MSEQNEKQVRPRREHIALTELSAQKIGKWLEQINSKKKVRISRKDLVNWLIEKTPENLSGGDLNAIIEKFYDEEAFLRQLLRDVKKAKADGNNGSLEVIVRTKRAELKKDLDV